MNQPIHEVKHRFFLFLYVQAYFPSFCCGVFHGIRNKVILNSQYPTADQVCRQPPACGAQQLQSCHNARIADSSGALAVGPCAIQHHTLADTLACGSRACTWQDVYAMRKAQNRHIQAGGIRGGCRFLVVVLALAFLCGIVQLPSQSRITANVH